MLRAGLAVPQANINGMIPKLLNFMYGRNHTLNRNSRRENILPHVFTRQYNSLIAMFLTYDLSHCFAVYLSPVGLP